MPTPDARGRDPRCADPRTLLIERHLPMVPWCFNRWVKAAVPPTVDPEDVLQAGRVALVECADRFNPTKGCSFLTYATPCVRGQMFRFLRYSDPVGPEVWEWERGVRAAERVLAKRCAPVTDEALAAAMNLSLAAYRQKAETYRRRDPDLPLDAPLPGSEYRTVADTLPAEDDPEAEVVARHFRAAVRAAVAQLPERERAVVEVRRLQGGSLKESGAAIGFSKEGARHVEKRALLRLGELLTAAGLAP